MREKISYEDLTKHQAMDSAALAGAAIAASLSVFGVPGPYVPLNGVVGLTLLVILFTYELKRYRSLSQNLAFGSVCALCSLLIMGFLIEWGYAGWRLDYWKILEEQHRSNVNYWHLAILWIPLMGAFAYLGFKNSLSPSQGTSQKEANQAKEELNVTILAERLGSVGGGHNLNLTTEQIVVLRSVEALKLTLDLVQTSEGLNMRSLIQPTLLAVCKAALASIQCPYGNPPSDIEVDFDSSRNMYQRCNHNPRHCWDYDTGQSINCPI